MPRSLPAPTGRRTAVLIALLFAITSAVSLVRPTPAFAWDDDSFSSGSEKELVTLTNRSRAAAGLKSLKVDSTLTSIARWRSKDMIERDYFSHDIPGYGKVFKKMDAKGFCYKVAGENIGWNTYPDDVATETVHDMFMDSSGHRKNILGKSWDVIGVGAYKGSDGKKMWTVLFADKCGSTAHAEADRQADAQAHAEADAPSPTAKPTPKPTAKPPKPKPTSGTRRPRPGRLRSPRRNRPPRRPPRRTPTADRPSIAARRPTDPVAARRPGHRVARAVGRRPGRARPGRTAAPRRRPRPGCGSCRRRLAAGLLETIVGRRDRPVPGRLIATAPRGTRPDRTFVPYDPSAAAPLACRPDRTAPHPRTR